MILPEIARAAELLPLLNQGHAMVGEGLRMRLFGPESRAWFHACRFWVLGGVPPASEEASLAVLRTLCFEDRRLANHRVRNTARE
ncbi:MAG TPA: hypothetical protein VN829_22730, partial [Dongiaceae bacterium]|nr:hypothetical protein [Dongiaceae bacterium]